MQRRLFESGGAALKRIICTRSESGRKDSQSLRQKKNNETKDKGALHGFQVYLII